MKLWVQHQNNGKNNKKDLVEFLAEHQRANSCVALISRLNSLNDDSTEGNHSNKVENELKAPIGISKFLNFLFRSGIDCIRSGGFNGRNIKLYFVS